jgi:hypothetical protein
MVITKSALHEDGMAGYEIDMFRKECDWDWVLLPKLVGGGRGRKTRKGQGNICQTVFFYLTQSISLACLTFVTNGLPHWYFYLLDRGHIKPKKTLDLNSETLICNT